MNEQGDVPDVAVAKNDEMLPGAMEYLEQLGVDTSGFSEEQRGRDYMVENPEARYFLVNASDAAEGYFGSWFDAAVTGSDWAFEHALRRGETQDVSWTPAYIVEDGAKNVFRRSGKSSRLSYRRPGPGAHCGCGEAGFRPLPRAG